MVNFIKHILILLISISLIDLCGCGIFSSTEYSGSIKGIVRDSTTHQGLNSVQISTIPATLDTTADLTGNFMIKDIPMSNSSADVTITASRFRYLSNTISIKMKSDDTVSVILALLPSDKVFTAKSLILDQFVDFFSLDAINLTNFLIKRDIEYDVDTKFRSNGTLVYMRTGYDEITSFGFQTKFSPFLGKFTKAEFDTLTSYYGASEPLDPITDFPYNNTEAIPAANERNNVYAFFLKGRYSPGNSYPIFGLMHIDSVWIAPGTNLYKIMLDVKINKLGQNYFVPPY